MASSRNETQITWSAANSVTVSSATRVASDALAFPSVEDWDGMVQVNADNASSPLSGDVCDVFVVYTSGDVLGDSGDDYDTSGHATFLGRLDTYTEDPARGTFPVNTAAKGLKIVLSCPQAASRNVVVRARLITHRPQ